MSSIYVYYDPVTEFGRLFQDALATRLCPRASTPSTEVEQAAPRRRGAYRPRMNIDESKDGNTVTATFELPGLTSDSVAIDVHQNRLTVSGVPPAQASDSHEERSYPVRERRSGRFSRTLQLPLGIKPQDVNAKMENGILTVTFPMTSLDQQPKRIAIQ